MIPPVDKFEPASIQLAQAIMLLSTNFGKQLNRRVAHCSNEIRRVLAALPIAELVRHRA